MHTRRPAPWDILLVVLWGIGIGCVAASLISDAVEAAQDTLSAQVLRLLDRTNTWTGVNTFTEDPIFAEVHTTAPADADCDEAQEIGKIWWDSTNTNLYLCAGTWRKFTSTAP